MKQGNWEEIIELIKEDDNRIFQDVNKKELTEYEKRKAIFDYLCNNTKYDFESFIDLLLKMVKNRSEIDDYIRSNNIADKNMIDLIYKRFDCGEFKKERNPIRELITMINTHIGICNSIAQYYKLLLEYNGIYSACVICDNMLPRNHQINLVLDNETSTYSFDDVTTAVISKNLKDKCFDYDLDSARDINQGIRPVGFLMRDNNNLFNSFGVILSSSLINYYVGRNDNSYLKYGLELDNNITLPKNIISRKKYRGDEDESTYRHK